MTVDGRGLKQVANAQTVEFVHIRIGGADGVTLVDGQGHGLAGFAQHGGHVLVRRGNAAADIRDHDDGIGQLNADLRLTAHELQHIVVGAGLDTAGIHQGEGAAAPFAVPIDPVPGHAGGVLHNGGPLTGELIKEHRLSHIGAAYNGNQGFRHEQHVLSFGGQHRTIRMRPSADLFHRLCSSKSGKYTKDSSTFRVFLRQKISR